MDALYAHISEDSNSDEKELFDLKEFIKQNEYDTEAVTDDINNNKDSNLFTYFDSKLVEFMKHFIKYSKCMFLFFSKIFGFVTFDFLSTKKHKCLLLRFRRGYDGIIGLKLGKEAQ